MNNQVRQPAPADVTTASLSLFAAKLESMDQRQQADTAALRSDVAELQTKVDRLENGQARIESLLVKLLEGQAVLHQNDMELKRRLDAAS